MYQLSRCYSELILYNSFEDRFEYLKLSGSVGRETFGFDRYLNQALYNSMEWQRVRNQVIARDLGCDLGVEGFDIYSKAIIHHMNPITVEDIEKRNPDIFNPEFLITTTHRTHNAIHYGDESVLVTKPITRTPNDTCPWKH